MVVIEKDGDRMSDAVADRGRPEPRYRVGCQPDQLFFWSTRGIPNFIRLAFAPRRKTASFCLDLMSDPAHLTGTRLKVYRLLAIDSARTIGELHWHHVATYIPIEEQPAQELITTKHAWEKWLRENDTEGDILSPRVDPSER